VSPQPDGAAGLSSEHDSTVPSSLLGFINSDKIFDTPSIDMDKIFNCPPANKYTGTYFAVQILTGLVSSKKIFLLFNLSFSAQ
jgi:hypothetical protein